MLADALPVEEGDGTPGDLIPMQHSQTAGLQLIHGERAPHPDAFRLSRSLVGHRQQPAGHLHGLPGQRRLPRRSLGILDAVTHGGIPRAVERHGIAARFTIGAGHQAQQQYHHHRQVHVDAPRATETRMGSVAVNPMYAQASRGLVDAIPSTHCTTGGVQ